MDYELRVIVEKVSIPSQVVVQRDTIKVHAVQAPASILGLGLRHAEQSKLVETKQLDKADKILNQALQVSQTIPDKESKASTLVNISSGFLKAQQLNKVTGILNQALGIVRSL